ncbi:hypothetical protein [Flavobacterium phage FL-1]|nr:hypothetical protein [Flavobacterium phage FL-1]
MRAQLEIRQEVWLKAYLTYMESDFAMKDPGTAKYWADRALKAFDEKFGDA